MFARFEENEGEGDDGYGIDYDDDGLGIVDEEQCRGSGQAKPEADCSDDECSTHEHKRGDDDVKDFWHFWLREPCPYRSFGETLRRDIAYSTTGRQFGGHICLSQEGHPLNTPYAGSTIAYDVIIDKDVMVTMRDGVQLAADIYCPAANGHRAEGSFPVILERTPYDKTAPRNVTNGKYYARRGYVTVYQDVRGRFASEGEWYAFAKEAPDGFDTAVAWFTVLV